MKMQWVVFALIGGDWGFAFFARLTSILLLFPLFLFVAAVVVPDVAYWSVE